VFGGPFVVALSVGVILQFVYADWDMAHTLRTLLGSLVLVFVLHAYLIVGISKGRRSARWIYLLFFIGGLAIAPPNLAEFASNPVVVSIRTGQVCLQALAFLLLFTPQANAWFKQQIPATLANGR
jgi:hypothetical protein